MELKNIEKKWQKKWGEAKAFEANPGKQPKFFLTFPYPYLNGPLHLGHAYTATRVDVLARFKRMQGFNVLFPFAWHVTGEPIAGVAERLKKGDEQQQEILLGTGIPKEKLKEFQDPEKIVSYYKKLGKIDVNHLGLSVDWRREFTTTPLTPTFSRFIEWQYNTLRKGGYVAQGTHPVIWCPSCESPTGDHDRLEGEGVTPVEFSVLKFKYEDSYICAGTLRPETVFGITNMWIDPNITYVKAKVDGENWIISRECADKLKAQLRKVEIVGEVPGKEMIGKYCEAPVIKKKILNLPAKFCDPTISTGIVTSVPSHAPYDWQGLVDLKKDDAELKKYGIDPEEVRKIDALAIIDLPGYAKHPAKEVCEKMGIKSQDEMEKLQKAKKIIYKAEFHRGKMAKACGEYAGMAVETCKDKIEADMIAAGEADKMWETSDPVVCRCGTKCIVKILENQWFLKYGDENWKKKATEALENCAILPQEGVSAFEYTIDWLRDKACARKGGLGTPLPWDKEWKVETLSDSTVYMAYYPIARVVAEKGIKAGQLTDEIFDFIYLGKGSGPAWAQEMKKEFEYWYPVDFRNSAKELIYNHLTFYLFQHAAIWPKKYWPRAIGVNGMINVEGKKMSKSTGNFVILSEALRKYSADTTRMGLLNTAEGLVDPDWRREYVFTLKRTLVRFLNLVEKATDKPCELDRWAESRLRYYIERATGHYEKTEFRSALQYAYFEPMNDLRWYLLRGGTNTRQFLEAITLLVAPVVPHVAEEAWSRLGGKGFVSFAEWPKPDRKKRDTVAEAQEKLVETVVADLDNIIKFKKIKAKKCYLYTAEPWKYKVRKIIVAKKERNPNAITAELMKNQEIRKHGKEVPRTVKRLIRSEGETLGREGEFKLLSGSIKFLEKYFGMKFEVQKAEKPEYDPSSKAKNAIPGKPAIYLVTK